MIIPYFIQMAVVKMSATLSGKELYDNYAVHGALERFCYLHVGEVFPAEGIDDVPEKSESFKFGQICGRILHEQIKNYTPEQRLYCEAEIVRNVLMKSGKEYPAKELKPAVTVILKALFKKAQIRTHTAKPGSEDINTWLSDYYHLQEDYHNIIEKMAGIIVTPDPALQEKYTKNFFCKTDRLTALAMTKTQPDAGILKDAARQEGGSDFEEILKKIILQVSG